MENTFKKAKNWLKNPMILIFFAITLFLLPTAINKNSISFRSAIVVAFGADLAEDNLVELCLAINVSSTTDSLSENTKIITTKGETIADAMANASLLIGRTMRLWHTRFVIIGERLASGDVSILLDSAIRTNKMRNTVQLLFTNSNIRDVFNVGIQLKSQTGINLSDLICRENPTSTTKITSNIDSFYRGIFSQSEISKINAVSMTGDITEGINPASDVQGGLGSSGEDGSGSDSSGGGQSAGGTNSSTSKVKDSYISNRGETAVFKQGRFVRLLSTEESQGLNWLNNEYIPKKLMVHTRENSSIKNAKINFEILKKDVTAETFFKDGVPFYSIKVYMHLDVDEIVSYSEGDVTANHESIDESIKKEVGRHIRTQLSNTLNIAHREKLDLFDFNTRYYQNNHKEYIQYIKNGHTKDDLIEDVNFACDVEIKII